MKASSAILAVAAAASAASAAPLTENQYQFLFSRFIEKYNKTYPTGEVFSKYHVFRTNLDTVMAHNEKGHTYSLSMNQFGDMTSEEFEKFMNSDLKLHATVFGSKKSTKATCDDLPGDLDWSAKINNPIKNQASCGSCWAFSVISALEYRYYNSLGQTTVTEPLSEQELVDCDYANGGCNGGLMAPAYDYIMKHNGICKQSDYEYTARDGNCNNSCEHVANPTSVDILKPQEGESGLVSQLAQGPVTIAIAASTSCFQFYSGGVITDCHSSSLNHAVTAVGYGTEAGVPYIKVRNSWGGSWGEQGYFRMKYCDNTIGVADSIAGGYDAYPIF